MAPSSLPRIEVYPHTECDEVVVPELIRMIGRALPLCLEHPGTESPILPGLDSVEINLVSDETIARVHDEFMDDPSATDVITFHHGEIFVSVDTARREGPENGNEVFEEILLYIVHGLLHLNGHTDLSEPERSRMHLIQENILRQVTVKAEN